MLAHGDERCVGVSSGSSVAFANSALAVPNRPWHKRFAPNRCAHACRWDKDERPFENGLALFEVVRERGGIKHLFYRKFGGVVDILFADFIVGAADGRGS